MEPDGSSGSFAFSPPSYNFKYDESTRRLIFGSKFSDPKVDQIIDDFLSNRKNGQISRQELEDAAKIVNKLDSDIRNEFFKCCPDNAEKKQ